MNRRLKLGCMVMLGTAMSTTCGADAPTGVTPTLLGRGTYDAFNVQGDPRSLDLLVESRGPIDLIVRTHDYAPGSSTGWHTHPGPVFITVLDGTVTFYDYDDPSCTPKVVKKGEGYVDTGHGHIGRNETGVAAKDVTVFFAPVAQAFRGELTAPGPRCKF